MKAFPKDTDSVLDFGFDWSKWLNTGKTILSSVWTVPAGLTVVSSSFSTTQTNVVLSGGSATLDTRYEVTNRITTSDNLTEDRSLLIRMGRNVGGEWRFE